MSMRSQTTIIVVSTLVIGILIGLFLAGPVLHRHLRPPFRGRHGGGFTEALEMLIDPKPEQAEAIRKVLDKHADGFNDINSRYHSEISAMMDSLRKDLDPLLTDEQRARLDKGRDHFNKMRDHIKPPEHPGPPR
jgi:hypothetical protein